MTYRQEHPIFFYTMSTICVCVAIVACIWTIGMYSVQASKIEAEKAIKTTEIHEREETERTEERNQFWQKLIPWGKDEAEEAKP